MSQTDRAAIVAKDLLVAALSNGNIVLEAKKDNDKKLDELAGYYTKLIRDVRKAIKDTKFKKQN